MITVTVFFVAKDEWDRTSGVVGVFFLLYSTLHTATNYIAWPAACTIQLQRVQVFTVTTYMYLSLVRVGHQLV